MSKWENGKNMRDQGRKNDMLINCYGFSSIYRTAEYNQEPESYRQYPVTIIQYPAPIAIQYQASSIFLQKVFAYRVKTVD